jgi:hypothetical protein
LDNVDNILEPTTSTVGGTPGKAPIGYLNARKGIDGREVRVGLRSIPTARCMSSGVRGLRHGQVIGGSWDRWLWQSSHFGSACLKAHFNG